MKVYKLHRRFFFDAAAEYRNIDKIAMTLSAEGCIPFDPRLVDGSSPRNRAKCYSQSKGFAVPASSEIALKLARREPCIVGPERCCPLCC